MWQVTQSAWVRGLITGPVGCIAAEARLSAARKTGTMLNVPITSRRSPLHEIITQFLVTHDMTLSREFALGGIDM